MVFFSPSFKTSFLTSNKNLILNMKMIFNFSIISWAKRKIGKLHYKDFISKTKT